MPKLTNDLTVTTDAELADTFEITEAGLMVRERRGLEEPWRVDLATLPGRGPVARRTVGTECQIFYEWDPVGRVLRQEIGSTFNALGALDMQLDRFASRGMHFLGAEPNPLVKAIAKFRSEYPELVPILDLERHIPRRIFDLGESPEVPHNLPGHFIEWYRFIDRHAGGNFGEYGSFDAEQNLTPAEQWSLPLQSAQIQNTEAVRAGKGAIRSLYKIDSPNPRKHAEIAVLTIFRAPPAGKIRTVCWLSEYNI